MPIELLPETPSQTAGPYVHIGLAGAAAGNPTRAQEIWNEMAKDDAPGEHIILIGKVIDGNGHLVRDSYLELWQANAGGRYRHKNDSYLAPLDPNFGGVGRTLTDANGYYYFRTIKPGPYPWRNGPNEWRPSHIHVSISGPSISTKLITQMYFEGDPLIPKCPIVRTIANPDAVETLIGRLDLSSNVPMDCLAYRFNIVLRGQRQTRFENQ